MDLYNNQKGRDSFTDLLLDAREHDRVPIKSDVENMVSRLLISGELIYIKDGVLTPTNR